MLNTMVKLFWSCRKDICGRLSLGGRAGYSARKAFLKEGALVPGFFEQLAKDTRRITLDCDVVAGLWTSRADIDGSPAAIERILARGNIDSALVASARGCWYDEDGGAAELKTWTEPRGWWRCNSVNLRDAIGIGDRLDEWIADGVRAIRLPGVTQGKSAASPGYLHIVHEAAARGLLMLVEGVFSEVQGAFRGLGAKVIFLDASYYELADFLLVAAEEPGFLTSTRKMLGPDSFERICDEVGATHLAFGSGSPLQDLEPTVWRLRDARISDDDFAAIAGGNVLHLLEGR